jgi:hypothetical protein
MSPIAITITGTTPLLCGRPVPDSAADGTDPAAQAAERLYRDTAGEPVIPGLNLFRCLTRASRACGRCPVELVHSLGIAERDIRIQSQRPWTVDTRWVRHPETGLRQRCHRPRFEDWRLDATLLVDRDAITPAEIRHLVEVAGMQVGLGDFRPDRGGPFGRFTISAWEPLS